MPDEKKLIDQILDDIKESESKTGTVSPDTKTASSFGSGYSGTSKKSDESGKTGDVFKNLKERKFDTSERSTKYFKHSRFQQKTIRFEETSDVISSVMDDGEQTDSPSDTLVYKPEEASAASGAEPETRSFKGQSVVDPEVNNGKNRLFFSKPIGVDRRISKPGATDDVFKAAEIAPERQLHNTFTDDIAGIVKSRAERENNAHSEVVEGQIRLTGFDEDTEPEKVNDEFVEEQLRATRLKKINEFNARKVFDVEDGEDGDEKALSDPATEQAGFEDESQRKAVPSGKKRRIPPRNKDMMRVLSERYNKAARKTLALVAIGVFNIILYFVFPAGGSLALYGAMNLALLIAAGVLCLDMFASGIRDIGKKKFGVNFTALIAYAAVFIQDVTFFAVSASHSAGDANTFQIGAILLLILRSWGRFSVEERIKNNFVNLSSFGDIYAVSNIKDSEIARQLGKGIFDKTPNIIYSARTKFISNFVQTSYTGDKFERRYGFFSVIMSCVSVLIALIAIISGAEFLSAITVFAALSCFAVPAATVLCSNLPLLRLSKELKNDGVILSYDAAEQCTDSNAVAIDVCSLYPKRYCSLYGIKTYNGMPVDRAILLITSALVAAENPLAGVFTDIIDGKTGILPDTQQCHYEDRLGISAWIDESRVLVGNREMMMHRGIDVLTPQVERKYLKNDRKILYLAVENVLSAMFVVSYRPDMKVKPYIKLLQDNDIAIMVRSTDPNISEQMLSHDFGTYETTFKIFSGRSAEIYRRYNKATHSKVVTSIAHSGNSRAMLKTVALSLKLKSALKTAFRINIISTAVFFLLFALSALIDAGIAISAPYLLISNMIVTALSTLIPNFMKKR